MLEVGGANMERHHNPSSRCDHPKRPTLTAQSACAALQVVYVFCLKLCLSKILV